MVAALYSERQDWAEVRKKVIENNLLQARTQASLQRICREVCSRLKTLNEAELHLFITGTTQEQKYLLWVAFCRRFRFIRDFAVEVLHEKVFTLHRQITQEDYNAFLNSKAEWHKELDRIKPATHRKLRQVLFRMLREVDLLDAENVLKDVVLPPRLRGLIARSPHDDFLVFPVAYSHVTEGAQ